VAAVCGEFFVRTPKTRYTKSGGVYVAYQVFGEGPIDLVWTPGSWNNVELVWEVPAIASAYRRFASFSRVITFDPRGSGLSDRGSGDDSLEERMDDLRAVLDACGSERAAICAYTLGGPMALLFSATFPERTRALVLVASLARLEQGRWFDASRSWDRGDVLAMVEANWGGPIFWDSLAPSLADHDGAREVWARFLRLSLSPTTAVAMTRVGMEVDLLPLLGSIRAPTLILCRTGDRFIDPEHSRILAEGIPGAKLTELPGKDSAWWLGDTDAIIDEIEEFLTGVRPVREEDRVVATVLFTDVVASTEKAAEVGDRSWRSLLDRHNALVRRELTRHRGREIKTVGDGFLATFDGPARAIRCAQAIAEGVRRLDVEIRAGLHTGEIERMPGDIRGIGVHIAARVMSQARPGEVVASSTVKDLVVGSGIEFEDRGTHALKGVPGDWRLYAVTSS
jgi:class 3 adenylate cyclase